MNLLERHRIRRNVLKLTGIRSLSTVVLVTFAVLAGPTTIAWTAEAYTYDALGRLTNVTFDDATSISYTYDSNGNLLRREARAAGPATDINSSGNVNAVDVQLVVNGALGIPLPNGLNPDVNRDGSTNAIDVQLVVNDVLGIG